MSLCLLKDTNKGVYFMIELRHTEKFIEEYENPHHIIELTTRSKKIDMIESCLMKPYAHHEIKTKRRDELINFIPHEYTPQRELYLGFKFYTMGYRSFCRDIRSLIKRGLIDCKINQRNGRQLIIKRSVKDE